VTGTPLPTGRFGRAARLAAAGAGRLLGRGDAGELAQALGSLRGLPAKLGQLGAYVDGLSLGGPLGAEALGVLFRDAPHPTPEEARRLVEEELGAPVDRLFATWEEVPFASASIGAVHRATLADGRAVAVKVQHPGVADAVESDLGNLGVLEVAVGMLGARKFDTQRLVAELAARFREELDYRIEAANQARFRAFHADDPLVLVPEVVRERSSRRVLTTSFEPGMSFAEACAAPEAARAQWCRTMWRFVYRSTVTAGLFNADPHPGNQAFRPDGRVVFYDFGCVQEVSEHLRSSDEDLHRAALRGDIAGFRDAGRRLLSLRGGPHEERSLAHLREMYTPLFHGSFRVTRKFAADLLARMREGGRAARPGPDLVSLPPGTLLMNRLQFGFYSVLARLDAEVDYAAVERGFLP
jgi:predicted unusual protein kinase regulating ubiquinone biosynthesis (AarF/ABC1/UbiB family)